MAAKPRLHYFGGRGRMETIRWLLSAAGVEFEEIVIDRKEQLQKLRNDGWLLFQQVPMVEIDGMKLVQTRAILNYVAAKYNLYGKDLKERALIDMYCEGSMELNYTIMALPFISQPDKKQKQFQAVLEKAYTRYFPSYEKVFKNHRQEFLVGKEFSRADVQLLESIIMMEELKTDFLSNFSLLKTFKAKMSNIPTIKKFLQPGSPRQPPHNEQDVANTMEMLRRCKEG